MYTYKTKGTCSTQIQFSIQNDVITHVQFSDGCAGNTSGVARLAQGRSVDEVITLLEGVQCRNGTSCPDQLANALKAYRAQNA